MSRQLDLTGTLFGRAANRIPYGVNSDFRYWEPEQTMVIPRDRGSCLGVGRKPIYRFIGAIFQRGQRLMDGMDEIMTRSAIPHRTIGLPQMFSFILGGEQIPQDFHDYCQGDDHLYRQLARAPIERSIMPDSDGREPWFLCHSHINALIDQTLERFQDTARRVKANL